MESELIGAIGIAALIILLAAGVPIAWSAAPQIDHRCDAKASAAALDPVWSPGSRATDNAHGRKAFAGLCLVGRCRQS